MSMLTHLAVPMTVGVRVLPAGCVAPTYGPIVGIPEAYIGNVVVPIVVAPRNNVVTGGAVARQLGVPFDVINPVSVVPINVVPDPRVYAVAYRSPVMPLPIPIR